MFSNAVNKKKKEKKTWRNMFLILEPPRILLYVSRTLLYEKNVDLACETAEIIKKYLILIYSQTFFDLQMLQTAKIALRHLTTY